MHRNWRGRHDAPWLVDARGLIPFRVRTGQAMSLEAAALVILILLLVVCVLLKRYVPGIWKP
jgi:hypothetical protein